MATAGLYLAGSALGDDGKVPAGGADGPGVGSSIIGMAASVAEWSCRSGEDCETPPLGARKLAGGPAGALGNGGTAGGSATLGRITVTDSL